MEKQQVTQMCLMDLSAAFDTVDHKVLLEVLGNEYGLGKISLEWFANYLSDRQCCVNINGSLSSSKRLDFSVPQGSLLGPVLYSAYASTLRYVIPDSFQLHGYADDHAIKQSHKPTFDEANTVRNEISTTMRDVKVWMDQNRLKLNETKTEYIQVGSKKLLSKCALDSICINNTTVNSSNCVKYLGAYLDSHLTLKTHIAAKCRAAMAGLRLVRNIRHLLTKDACHTIVLGLVISHLDYANSLYANLPNVVIMMLQRIQNMAAKLVLKRGKEDSASEALKELHWLPIRQRILHKILTLVFKCVVDKSAPQYLISRFTLAPQSSRSLRSNNILYKLIIPRTQRATFASRAISVFGAEQWNKLPNHVKHSENLAIFKRKLKTYLFPG